ncbi:hypothetical protein C8R42DRAFT_199306 [Lentinula raphanica]|nr:hypothetical protein C8R42DRAFT_199306 [Lentinula raphanica]
MATRGKSISRRSRAAQACITCRKNKARCELLDDLKTTEILRCHRCKTLDLRCSHQDADRQLLRVGRRANIQAWEQVIDLTDVEPSLAFNSSTLETTATSSVRNTESSSLAEESVPTAVTSSALDLKVLPQIIWNYRRVEIGQWRYCGNDTDNDHYDWSAPMTAIHQISAQYQAQLFHRTPVELSQRVSPQRHFEVLEDILEQTQIEELLRIFHEGFSPWSAFSVTFSDSFPLLKLVCCTIASRQYLPSLVADRLLHATEHAISQIIVHPPPAYALESIQALILIVSWTPLPSSNEPEQGWSDPHLLLSSAVSLATKIRLNEAPNRYTMLKMMKEQGLDVDPLHLENAAISARVWLSLTNTESILCIGTHRSPFSHRDRAYLQCFPRFPSDLNQLASSATTEAGDIRLRLFSETLSATEEALSLRLNSMEEFEAYYHALTDTLERIDNCTRALQPLKFGSDSTQISFYRAQIVISRCFRLLVIHNPANVSRRLSIQYGPQTLRSRFYTNVHSEVFTPLGKDALRTCEELFISLQELLESVDQDARPVCDHFLATAPDYFFHLILHAGIFITSFKFMVFNAQKIMIQGASDLMFERIVNNLRLLRVPRTHPAKKCADLMGGLLELWQSREQLSLPRKQGTYEAVDVRQGDKGREECGMEGDTSSGSDSNSPYNTAAMISPVLGYPLTSAGMSTEGLAISQSSLNADSTGAISMPVFNGGNLGDEWSDIFQDAQFWQNFLIQQAISGQQ